MSGIRRWDPFNDMLSLRDAMNQLLEESYVSPSRASNGSALSMPLNVSETQDAFIVEAVVPGLKPDDLDITLQDNVLTIRGETRQEQQTGDKQASYHLVERRYGNFSRSISLPTQVKSDAVQATMEHGILRLEIPKAEQVRPRKITVNSGTTNNTAVEVNGQH